MALCVRVNPERAVNMHERLYPLHSPGTEQNAERKCDWDCWTRNEFRGLTPSGVVSFFAFHAETAQMGIIICGRIRTDIQVCATCGAQTIAATAIVAPRSYQYHDFEVCQGDEMYVYACH